MRGAFGALVAGLVAACMTAWPALASGSHGPRSARPSAPQAHAARASRASAAKTPGSTTPASTTPASTTPASTTTPSAPFVPPPIKHVFVIVDENQSAATTFGPNSPAPYLSRTLRAQGAILPQYYAIGHASLPNYIAMVSGQAPNPVTSADCSSYVDFSSIGLLHGQQTGAGCIYPAGVPSLMSQLNAAHLTWRAYEDGMGVDPARDNAAQPTDPNCGHPAVGGPDPTQTETPTDPYAVRHDPFVYFHYVIDNPARCNADVVPLSRLAGDLRSAASTPNFVFITPGLCNDGHDAPCANGLSGGLPQADAFLRTIVPEITRSPAYRQSGLLLITFDEASVSDVSSCCNETAGPYNLANGIPAGGSGAGGGDVGAILLSPYIKPGTVSITPYNHYSTLGSIESIFGLQRLGEAATAPAFGPDVYSQPDGTPVSMPAELNAELSAGIAPSKPLSPPAMAARGYQLPFRTPEAGALTVQWFTVPPGASAARARRRSLRARPARATLHRAQRRRRLRPRRAPAPMLVASATEAFAQAGSVNLQLTPTTAALQLLERSRSLRLRATATFTTHQHQRITVNQTFVLH